MRPMRDVQGGRRYLLDRSSPRRILAEETGSRMRFPESIVRKMYAVSNRLKLLANLTASCRCISASFVMSHTRAVERRGCIDIP